MHLICKGKNTVPEFWAMDGGLGAGEHRKPLPESKKANSEELAQLLVFNSAAWGVAEKTAETP